MKTRWFTNILLFVSSYSPLALIVAIRDLQVEQFQVGEPSTWFKHGITVLILVLGAVVSSWICLKIVRSFRSGVSVDIRKSENHSNELVNYSLPYIVSFVSLDLGDITSWGSFLVFFGVMFALAVRTQSLFVNPILVMFGYGLYSVELEDNGKVRQELVLSPKPLGVGDRCEVMWLSPFLLLAISVSRQTQIGHDEHAHQASEN